MALAAGLERASEHPLATAIVDAATEADVRPGDAASVTAVPGHGLEGTIDGRLLRIGRPEWSTELGIELSPALQKALAAADQRAESAVVLIGEDEALAVISVADRVREQSRETIRRLRSKGLRTVMITGDAEAVAATIAVDLGIDRYHARVLPDEKSRLVTDLKREGPTMFVGDGINDAPALLAADLGIAIGAGTNVAIESADLVLVENDPADVTRALALSRETHRKMVQNLAWATGYNALALPLAAGVAAGAGILLAPAVGAVFMSLSTVIVAINAMMLRRVDLEAS